MTDHNKNTLGLGKAFFGLFLAPLAFAGVAIAALFNPVFAVPVLIAVLVFAVIYTILYFLFLHRFIDCVCDNCYKHKKH